MEIALGISRTYDLARGIADKQRIGAGDRGQPERCAGQHRRGRWRPSSKKPLVRTRGSKQEVAA